MPSLPDALDRVVAQAMAVDPAQRYENAGQLAADLERVVRGAEPLARETAVRREPLPDRTVTRRLQRPRRRRWPAFIAGAAAIAAAAAIVAAS